MSVYFTSVVQLRKMINNLDKWLGKAAEHATTKGFDATVLVNARLAPDQFSLGRQVQAACDAAKLCAARLADKEAPKHEDTETTIDQLRARAQAVVEYLGTFTAEDFDGAGERVISLPFAPGMVVEADDYMMDLAVPNTYFHVCMAYAILRHNGVMLGKADYIGGLNMRPA